MIQRYFKSLVICLIIGGQVQGAAEPSSSTQITLAYSPTPKEAWELLGHPVEDILSVLPPDPEERKHAVLELIEMSSPFFHNLISKPKSTTLFALCEATQFDQWDSISDCAFDIFKRLGLRAVDVVVASGSKKRIYEIAEHLSRTAWLYPEDLIVLEKCFMAGEGNSIYFIKGTSHGSLFGYYLFHLFRQHCLVDIKVLSPVCARLTDEEFAREIKRLIFRYRWQFKAYLWENRSIFSTGTHPYMVLLQNVVAEMEDRVNRWIKQLGLSRADFPSWHYYRDYERLEGIYAGLLEDVLRKEHPSRDDCLMLLEMFRNFYAGGEYSRDVAITFSRVLLKLGQVGIKPNARLFPHDPTDKRTLMSEWLVRFDWGYLHEPHLFFKAIVSLLTEAEFDEVLCDLKETDAFFEMFMMWRKYLKRYTVNEGKWDSLSIKGLCLKKICNAGRREREIRGTLFGKLLRALSPEHEALSELVDSCGYAYPSPSSALFLQGSIFAEEPEEPITDENDVAGPSSSTSVEPAHRHNGVRNKIIGFLRKRFK